MINLSSLWGNKENNATKANDGNNNLLTRKSTNAPTGTNKTDVPKPLGIAE